MMVRKFTISYFTTGWERNCRLEKVLGILEVILEDPNYFAQKNGKFFEQRVKVGRRS